MEDRIQTLRESPQGVQTSLVSMNQLTFLGTTNTFAAKLSIKLQENNFFLWN